MLVELDGIKEVDLHRQREFLVSRADHWSGKASESHAERELATAATLLRDAASLSLLLEEIETARKQLVLSGSNFLRAGRAAGATLMVLADAAAPLIPAFFSEMVGGRSHTEGADQRFPPSASSAFQTMVSRHQVGWLTNLGPFTFEAKAADDREAGWSHMDGHLVGYTGLSFGSYRAAMEAMEPSVAAFSGGAVREMEMPTAVGQALYRLGVNRAEDLRLAMADRHHWRMMLRPSALIDYDAVALMCRALMSGLVPDSMRQAMQMERPAVDAPLRAAELLRPVLKGTGESGFGPALADW